MAETSSQQAPVLTSLPLLDALRTDPNTTWTRESGSNLDVLVESSSLASTSSVEEPSEVSAICHLDTFLPFTTGDKRAFQDHFEGASAIALAAHHLNVGDGSIVPQVQGLNTRCPIRFTVQFADTEYSGRVALEHVVNVTNAANTDSNDPQRRRMPCAFIGADRSSVSIPTSILTSLRNYPQISGGSTSAELDDRDQFPLFGRTIPSDHGNAVPIIQFMRRTLGITHLAVINVNDAYGNSFVQGLRLAAEVHAPDMKIHQSTVDDSVASMRSALRSVKETQYRYVFAVVFTAETHDTLLLEAYKMELAGTGKHQWLFGDSFIKIGGRVFEADSPLIAAYRGVGMLEATGGVPGLDGYEKFQDLLADVNNPTDMEYLFSIFPRHDEPAFQEGIDDFVHFLTPVSAAQASFVYEAAIALGLAACQTAGVTGQASYLFLDGRDHLTNLVNSVFQGVNGDVVFDPETGSKEPSFTLYKVTNFVDGPISASEEEGAVAVVQFKETFTHIYKEGAWEELSPFVFNDGSTKALSDIAPVSVDNVVLLPATRATVLVMCAIVVILGVGLMAWTQKNRKARVVLASQPFFLHTICLGAIVMGCTIIPLSIDHGIVSLHGCAIACTSILWLGAMGFSTTISALCTKTHRINIILTNSNRMQRIKVTVWDVAKPMIVLLSTNAIILSVMSALSPAEYELIVESEDAFGRPQEIRGQCDFQGSLPYILCVCMTNFGALLFTIAQAFKARNLSTEFAESAQIFRALITIIVVLFVGGPVLLLARDNANAFVFVASAIIFVTCSSILLLLFIPKIQILRESLKRAPNKQRIHITGVELTPSLAGSRMTDSFSDGEDNTEEFTGMKILTTKTPQELVKEVEELKRLLRRARAPKQEDVVGEVVESSIRMSSSRLPRRKGSILKNNTSDDASWLSQSGKGTQRSIDDFETHPPVPLHDSKEEEDPIVSAPEMKPAV